MYRPDGWKNPYSILPKHMEREYPVTIEWDAYEAGADAMYQPAYDKGKEDGKKEVLEALKKDGDYINIQGYGTQNVYYPKLLIKPAMGYVVFIPEEE